MMTPTVRDEPPVLARGRLPRLVVQIFLLCLLSAVATGTPAVAQPEAKWAEECTGPFKGLPLSSADLDTVLARHKRWLESDGRDGTPANLCGAALRGANLSGAALPKANLSGASLRRANLSGAGLPKANLSGVDLGRANLGGADLFDANVSGAYLGGANLRGAALRWANLSRADLRGANLSGADLGSANLSGAVLDQANLHEVLFEPLLASVDQIVDIGLGRNLSTLRFNASPTALVTLREYFRRRGLRAQEREITYAIRRQERIHARERGTVWQKAESRLSHIFFELPVGYGLFYGRPLRVLGVLIPLFALCYALALQTPGRDEAGLWQVWSTDRVIRTRGNPEPVLLTSVAWPDGPGPRRVLPWYGVLGFALYFSFLSAFHIGWRELNAGSWIVRLQPREYTLRATGWVRVVSGVQSLISVYLVALWALTYFGRPFD